MTEDQETFGARLRRLREEQGLGQKDVAEKAGLVQSLVSRYERGELVPSLEVADRLARALGKRLRIFEGVAWPER